MTNPTYDEITVKINAALKQHIEDRLTSMERMNVAEESTKIQICFSQEVELSIQKLPYLVMHLVEAIEVNLARLENRIKMLETSVICPFAETKNEPPSDS